MSVAPLCAETSLAQPLGRCQLVLWRKVGIPTGNLDWLVSYKVKIPGRRFSYTHRPGWRNYPSSGDSLQVVPEFRHLYALWRVPFGKIDVR